MAKKKNDVLEEKNGTDRTDGTNETDGTNAAQSVVGWQPVYATEDLFDELDYIPVDLRGLAVEIDCLTLDTSNVKDHGEDDLPVHQASLREFGIQRAAVVQRSTGTILAGNGMALAAKRNGWKYIPITVGDFDEKQARAFALADNAVGTLAGWNEVNLAKIAAESESLFSDFKLQEMTSALMADMQKQLDAAAELEEAEEEEAEPKVAKETKVKPEDIELCYRVIATCKDQKDQIQLLTDLVNQGYECRLSTLQVKN